MSLALIIYSALIAVGMTFLVVVILRVHARTKSKPNWEKDLGA